MMPLLEDVKSIAERVSGIARPFIGDIAVRVRKPQLFRFSDDGQTPNNPSLPFVHYRTPVVLDPAFDPAAIFESLFAAHHWTGSWRDGVYDFLHFHTHAHEVLGIARGHVRVRFGGKAGRIIALKAGDVAILPAGTGHKRVSQSKDLLVVGAYPTGSLYDQPRPADIDHATAVRDITRVKLPKSDPVYGPDGPLMTLWRQSRAT